MALSLNISKKGNNKPNRKGGNKSGNREGFYAKLAVFILTAQPNTATIPSGKSDEVLKTRVGSRIQVCPNVIDKLFTENAFKENYSKETLESIGLYTKEQIIEKIKSTEFVKYYTDEQREAFIAEVEEFEDGVKYYVPSIIYKVNVPNITLEEYKQYKIELKKLTDTINKLTVITESKITKENKAKRAEATKKLEIVLEEAEELEELLSSFTTKTNKNKQETLVTRNAINVKRVLTIQGYEELGGCSKTFMDEECNIEATKEEILDTELQKYSKQIVFTISEKGETIILEKDEEGNIVEEAHFLLNPKEKIAKAKRNLKSKDDDDDDDDFTIDDLIDAENGGDDENNNNEGNNTEDGDDEDGDDEFEKI